MPVINTFVGIDVAKADFVVACRPQDTSWTATNDATGITATLDRVRAMAPWDLPREVAGQCSTLGNAPAPARRPTADVMFERMSVGGESFWSVVYEPFMSRDLTRDALRAIIARGLEQTKGSYKALVQLFNLPPSDYKRVLNLLRKYDCHMPFQHFRSLPAQPGSGGTGWTDERVAVRR